MEFDSPEEQLALLERQKATYKMIAENIQKPDGFRVTFDTTAQYSDPSQVDADDRRKSVHYVLNPTTQDELVLPIIACLWTHFWHYSSIAPTATLFPSTLTTSESWETAKRIAIEVVEKQQQKMIQDEKDEMMKKTQETRERLGLPPIEDEDESTHKSYDIDHNESLGYNVPRTLADRETASKSPIHVTFVPVEDLDKTSITLISKPYAASNVSVTLTTDTKEEGLDTKICLKRTFTATDIDVVSQNICEFIRPLADLLSAIM